MVIQFFRPNFYFGKWLILKRKILDEKIGQGFWIGFWMSFWIKLNLVVEAVLWHLKIGRIFLDGNAGHEKWTEKLDGNMGHGKIGRKNVVIFFTKSVVSQASVRFGSSPMVKIELKVSAFECRPKCLLT